MSISHGLPATLNHRVILRNLFGRMKRRWQPEIAIPQRRVSTPDTGLHRQHSGATEIPLLDDHHFGHAQLLPRVSQAALSIKAYPNLPSNRETAEYLKLANEDERNKHLYNCYIDTLEKLKASIDEKSKPLSLAYSEIIIGASAFAMLAVFIIIRELTA